ncbi:DUF397 domain-containing protein [Streptomyces sp. NPDC127051]|uniref:DUF397 domain-containing protein n=1 Tax=Streptomyces sp. NPDC127051 TaxID=3347119 RepID=UPI0036676FD6
MTNHQDQAITWVKSSYSSGDGGQCVETTLCNGPTRAIHVRDSKCPAGPILRMSVGAFNGLVELARADS